MFHIFVCRLLHTGSSFLKLLSSIGTKVFRNDSSVHQNYTHLFFNRLFSGFSSSVFCVPTIQKRLFKYAFDSHILSTGDYYEFGVFKGYSIWFAQKEARKYNSPMHFFGFDSFEGLPKLDSIDDTNEFYKGQYSASKKEVSNNISLHGGNLQTIHLIKGFFHNSLNAKIKKKLHMNKISIAYIDCDLYSSTKDVLRFIKGMLIKNSLLYFDDWNAFAKDNSRGQRRAFFEFQKKHPEIRFELLFSSCWHGQVFRVRSISTSPPHPSQ